MAHVAERVVVSVAIVLAAMALYNAVATWREDGLYSPPGKMVDVDGHSLHLHCYGGSGEEEDESGREWPPTVVFDHATMRLSQQFHKVIDALQRHPGADGVRVCLIDRAGYGFSEPAPSSAEEGNGRSTPEAQARILHLALRQAGEHPPFVLVGHSRGAINQLMYAARYGPRARVGTEDEEEEVVGLVLIDPMPPGFRLPSKLQAMKRTVASGLRAGPWLARLGLVRNFLYLSSLTGQAEAIYSGEMLPYRRWVESKASYWHAVLDEFDQDEDENAVVERHERDILARRWTLPLVVISAGRFLPSFDASARDGWLAGMRRLANYSEQGRLIVAEESGHDIPSEQPALIADAIASLFHPR